MASHDDLRFGDVDVSEGATSRGLAVALILVDEHEDRRSQRRQRTKSKFSASHAPDFGQDLSLEPFKSKARA
jgi:hypothetical protein